ncbi:unnamed protein product [Urochloa decumbens]|uniref:F-box domain-containing protein n=1 Tax=Urochloa decumbens TaxID=240449 RepID=A0ABC9BYU6_9POAL
MPATAVRTTPTTMAISATPPPPWSELLPDLLGRVIAHLPFPADRSSFRAVCRAWHSAARCHARQLPWLVLPDGSFCTVGHDEFNYFHRGSIPGLLPDQDDTDTCVVGSSGTWLALDCGAADEDHRDYVLGKMCGTCSCCVLDADVKRRPSYRLHNPFTGATILLPGLDGIITSVTRRFQIRKVLMRLSDDPGDVIAVVTNNLNYNIILCRPGKGTDTLSPPIVTKKKRVIKNLLPEGKKDYWSWVDEEEEEEEEEEDEEEEEKEEEEDDDGDDCGSDSDNDEVVSNSTNEEGEVEADDEAQNEEEEADSSSDEEEEVDDESQNEEEEADSSSGGEEEDEDTSAGDGMIPDGKVIVRDEESPNDCIITTRKLVRSQAGELLMVREHVQAPRQSIGCYIREVEIFKADIDAGKWLPITAGSSCLAEDEALFLSRSFSKSTRVHGDIKAGAIHFDKPTDMFDTTSWTCIPTSLPLHRNLYSSRWSTWIFPQELVV